MSDFIELEYTIIDEKGKPKKVTKKIKKSDLDVEMTVNGKKIKRRLNIIKLETPSEKPNKKAKTTKK